MKYVTALDPAQQTALEQHMKSSSSHRVRQRAHAILLSARGYSIEQLADIFAVHRSTISEWIDSWNSQRLDGLPDAPRSGRPGKLTEAEEQMLIEAVEANPRYISEALAELKKRRAQA